MLKRLGVWGVWFALAFLTFGPTIASRNGSGIYTIPNTFVSGGTITSSGQNQNFSDLGNEISNSVAADGQTSMTGPLKAANGTCGGPALSFASNTNTGLYRKSSNTIGICTNGTEVAYIDANGLTVSGTFTSSHGETVLPGTIIAYAASPVPTGYLLANGQAVSRTTYAALFAVLGTGYGSGDGSTTFNLPDLTGRVVAGKEAAATRLTSAVSGVDGGTLGASGGGQGTTLITANLPPYTPAGAVGPATTTVGSGVGGLSAGANTFLKIGTGQDLTSAVPTFTGTAQGGTSTPFSTVQPTIVLTYLIKT